MKFQKTKGKEVMMIGTNLTSKGGISSVVQGYFDAGIVDRLGIRYFPTHRDGTKAEKIVFYVKGIYKIVINMLKYHIVHVHTASRWCFRRLFPIIFLAKILSRNIVIHLHGAKFDIYYSQALSVEKLIIRSGFSLSDKVVVLSSDWSRKVMTFCESRKITIIPNSIQVDRLRENILKEKSDAPRTILFMGELGQRKGVYDLIDAIALLRLNNAQIKVFLCGNGEVEKVKKCVADLGLEKIVNVPGWISGQEKKKLLNKAYLYILPSYFEGLPMSILEAMATGTPVISTPVGGIAEAVEDGVEGFLVEPGDIKALASAIRTLLDDTVVWKKMSVTAMEKIQSQFSSKQGLAQLKTLYNDLGVTQEKINDFSGIF